MLSIRDQVPSIEIVKLNGVVTPLSDFLRFSAKTSLDSRFERDKMSTALQQDKAFT